MSGDPYVDHLVVRMQRTHCASAEPYYSYDNAIYTSTFPVEWATNHEVGTGPQECVGCFEDGCWNGVFIGYCAYCARDAYRGARGRGFISPGLENCSSEMESFRSAFTTYLSDIPIDTIGDSGLFDSRQAIDTDNLNMCSSGYESDAEDYNIIIGFGEDRFPDLMDEHYPETGYSSY